MHWAAVDTDREPGGADEPDQLEEGGLIDQVHAILRDREIAGRFSDDDDADGIKGVTKLFDHGIAERLARSTGEGMEDDERWIRVEAREGIAAGQRKPELLRERDAERLGELQVAVDRVSPTIHFRDVPIKKARSFPA